MEMHIIKLVDFKNWFWDKFEEWRKGTTNGPTAFARYLGIKQQLVSSWLDGKYKPRNAEHISLLYQKYPDVYEVLGLPVPEPGEDVSFGQWPESIRRRLEAADLEIRKRFKENAITNPESEEAERIVIEVMEDFGFKYTGTSNGND